MVLDGLEDNDDFWNVAPSDDDEVPVVDSNQGQLGMDFHGCRDSRLHCPRIDHRMKDRQEAAQSPRGFHIDKPAGKEYSLTRPEMLPNGRYMYEVVFTLFAVSHCIPPGVTIPVRISRPAAICGMPRSFLSIQLT